MSTGGQALGAVVGGVAGFFLGGPLGALQGAALGSGIGAALDPPKGPSVQGPRLSDLSVQTSTYGAFIPRVYGTIGIHGNLLWLENNKLKETVRKKKQGGKGGGGSKTTVTTYSYSATFALGLCQGPIAGIRRIWCSDKLIYNAGSDDLETIIASNQAAKGWKLYTGTDDQMPDPRYEADVGVGNASAFRGIAYLAFYDFQLAKYGNTLQAAQFKVEVVKSGESFILPIDEAPGISDNFSWLRVFGEIGDLYGVRVMDFSTPRGFGGTNASFVYRNYRLGMLGPALDKVFISDIAETEFPSTVRSNDSRLWRQYKSTDTFITRRPYIRSDDGLFIHMSTSTGYAQDIMEYSRKDFGRFTTFYLFFTFNSTPDRSDLDRIAFAPVIDNGAGPFSIINTLIQESGWNVCTAGDVPFQWNITGASDSSVKQFNIRTYDASLSGIVSTFSGALPATWPRMTSGSRQEQKVVCRIANGAAYLLGKDRTDDGKYRFAIITSDGTIEEYSFSSPNAAGEELCTLWPHDENQGIALTSNLIVQWRRYNDGGAIVSEVIESEVTLSGLLSSSDIDASMISETARGYRVSGGTIRAAIEPLQAAFPFDVVPSGYQIKCVPRGQESVATIPWEDLGAVDGDASGDIFRQSREMDSQLPARTTIKYLDAAREYAEGTQYAERINTEAINRVDRELPLVLTADEAAGVAEVLQFLPWLERSPGAFSLPPIYLPLEPSDVITVTTPDAAHQLRLTEINYSPDGRLQCKAKPSRAALYTPNASGGDGVAPDGAVPLDGETEYLLLDIPVVDETIQNAPGISLAMTGTTSGWPGGVLFRSSDEGQTWTDLQAIVGKCTMGACGTAMPARSGSMIDRGSSLVVTLLSGELESITEAQMLVGANYAAYGVDGRWEIIRFQNATLNGDGSYTLDTFVRGDRGTEQYAGTHQSGDLFVLLDDPDNAFVGFPTALLGVPMSYRGITTGASIDTDIDQSFTYRGVNLECLSPVNARGVRDVSGNFTGTFYRRSRLSSSWWVTGVPAPVGEATEAYEIDVMSGSTVVRTITASTPTFSYTAAQQTTDFGSAQTSITFRIFQISAAVGRGYPYQVTL